VPVTSYCYVTRRHTISVSLLQRVGRPSQFDRFYLS
jgi:hypothetical protein